MKDYDYMNLVNSEMNFMKSIQDYVLTYIEKYCEEGIISPEQRDMIISYHNESINKYIENRLLKFE